MSAVFSGVYSFDAKDAMEYGVEAAVILYNIRFWILKNKANERHFHDGRYWTYNSKKAWAALFPFIPEARVRRIIDGLVKKGVLVTGNYNSSPFDRTLWFAFANPGKLDLSDLPNGFGTGASPIPDNKTDNKQEKEKLKKEKVESFGEYEYLRPVLERWLEYKAERRECYKSLQSIKVLAKKLDSLSGHSIAAANEIVEQSIANNWAGLFPLRRQETILSEKERRAAQRDADIEAWIKGEYVG